MLGDEVVHGLQSAPKKGVSMTAPSRSRHISIQIIALKSTWFVTADYEDWWTQLEQGFAYKRVEEASLFGEKLLISPVKINGVERRVLIANTKVEQVLESGKLALGCLHVKLIKVR